MCCVLGHYITPVAPVNNVTWIAVGQRVDVYFKVPNKNGTYSILAIEVGTCNGMEWNGITWHDGVTATWTNTCQHPQVAAPRATNVAKEACVLVSVAVVGVG